MFRDQSVSDSTRCSQKLRIGMQTFENHSGGYSSAPNAIRARQAESPETYRTSLARCAVRRVLQRSTG
jgi:hypothetical protein